MTTLRSSEPKLRMPALLIGVGICCLLALMPGCGSSDEPADSDGGGSEFSEEELKLRDERALDFAQKAMTAPRPDKVRYLRKLIAFYPESKYAPQAHSELILYLLHPELNEPEEAWAATQTFAERHPTDARACEAYSWMHKHFRKKDPKRAASILDEWTSYLDRVIASDKFEGVDHKASFVFARSEVAFEQGDAGQCEELLKEISGWDLKEQNRMLTTVFRLGNLSAARGGALEAKSYYDRALTLISAGARGPSAEVVQAEIKKLKR